MPKIPGKGIGMVQSDVEPMQVLFPPMYPGASGSQIPPIGISYVDKVDKVVRAMELQLDYWTLGRRSPCWWTLDLNKFTYISKFLGPNWGLDLTRPSRFPRFC